MRVTIALATYNGERYLQEQLDSFLAQTRLPDELIVVDDKSTDGTLNILRQFADSAPFSVRWFQNDNNLGYCGNFNQVLLRVDSDIVFLSDQDDDSIQLMDCNFSHFL